MPLPDSPLVSDPAVLRIRRPLPLPTGLTLAPDARAHEALRAYAGDDGVLRAHLLEAHLESLRRSCDAAGLRVDPRPRARDLITELIERHEPAEDCLVEVTAEPVAGRGAVLTAEITAYSRTRWLATGDGVHLTTGTGTAQPSGDTTAGGCPAALCGDALICGPTGISGAPELTVVALTGSTVLTHPPAELTRPPVMRDWVLTALTKLGLRLRIGQLLPAELGDADEILVCGTELEFAPVRTLDGTTLSGWPALPVSTRTVDDYFRSARRPLRAAGDTDRSRSARNLSGRRAS